MENEVLPQDEIDSLLRGAPEQPAAPAATTAPPEPDSQPAPESDDLPDPVPAPLERAEDMQARPGPEPSGPPGPAPAGATELARLADRLDRLETVVGRLDELNLQDVAGTIEEILGNLKATIGYRARSTFECNSCGSKGTAAIPLVLTCVSI